MTPYGQALRWDGMTAPSRRTVVIAFAVTVGGVVLLSVLMVLRSTPEDGEPLVARDRAEAFLDRYVDPDGRVVRLDQGRDTVSEGQAYGMLLAVVAGDEERFDRIWQWTGQHLQRDDGLLSWLWRDGEVVDQQSATDADLEAAWALLLAGDRFDREDFHMAASELAAAVLDGTTSQVNGMLVLAAGPWARQDPIIVNPSYLVPPIFHDLARATGDPRWDEVRDSSQDLLRSLTEDGQLLPPNWARLDDEGDAVPVDSPSGDGTSGQYGLDAARVPVRLATSCAREDRALAGVLWEQRLHELEDGGAHISYSRAGGSMDGTSNALGLVGAAAGAFAAGEGERARDLLDRAEAMSEANPTYYGDAWVALGRALLTTSLLARCGPGA